MTNSKNKFAGVLLAALMTVSAVTAPAFMTTNDLTESVSIVQTIEANAATLYAPKLTNGHYIIGYCTSDSNVPVYADKNFKKRGASTSKYGNVSYYNAYISGGSDEIKIYAYTSSYCYVSYPAGKTTKFGYIKASAVFPMNETKKAYTAPQKITTYKKSSLNTSYGYIAKGDTVYTVGKSGNNYKVIYNISGGNWKMAWIDDGSHIITPTVYSQTDSRWGSYQYGYSDSARRNKATLSSSGCGILSYVNAVYYLNGKFINPKTLADWSVNHGYRINGVGTAGGLYKAYAEAKEGGKYYGIAYAGYTNNYNTLASKLQSGQVAIGSAPGHLMAVVAYNPSTKKFLILDSYKSSNRGTYSTGYTWKTASECKANAKLNFSGFYLIKKS